MEEKNPEWRRKVKDNNGMAGKFRERFATAYREPVKKRN
jgi:hypothetical protein